MTSSIKNIRLWPLTTIFILTVLAIGIVWLLDAAHRQNKVALTVLILTIAFLLLIVWLLGFSRLTSRVKFVSFSAILSCITLFVVLFRFNGFSGDLVPKFEWRWRSETESKVGLSYLDVSEASFLTDYPQFLGPDRNATISGINLNTDWKNTPPELVWRIPVGAGWSGFAVVNGSAITQEQEDEWEKVVCYDFYTGQEKWTHKDLARYYTSLGGLGPRATPTVDGDRVYTVGGTGILNCLDFETGKQIWSTNIFDENRAEAPPWGVSVSPLIYDELVIVSAGGAVAYYKDSGEIAWTGHRVQSAYSSPVLLTLAGTPQVVLFDNRLITSHDPNTGHLLWKQSWPAGVECVTQPTPLPGDRLLVSTAYGIGTKLFQITKGNLSTELNVKLVWKTIRLKAKFTTIIYYKDYLYALDDGIFTCINPTDGSRQWKKGRYGHGQTLLISDILLVLTESGKVVLLEPNPEEHIELGQFQVLTGRTWNTPAIAGNYLLVRNSREAACYRLPLK
ncbi:PQQ-binding-like beta-propeller repeat protein [Candidatus Poribacteria bacterium]|nr:PQQ-binding-like beta-propeller repeat protein [Candidatus Poribacteria bacterium]